MVINRLANGEPSGGESMVNGFMFIDRSGTSPDESQGEREGVVVWLLITRANGVVVLVLSIGDYIID